MGGHSRGKKPLVKSGRESAPACRMVRKQVLKVREKEHVDYTDWIRIRREYPHIANWYVQQLSNRANRTLDGVGPSPACYKRQFSRRPAGAYFFVLFHEAGVPVGSRDLDWWATKLRECEVINEGELAELGNPRTLRDSCLRVADLFKCRSFVYGTVTVGGRPYTIRLKLERQKRTGRLMVRWTQPKVSPVPPLN